ncbi:MAG: hypothetical protein DSZ15_01505 [Candidatus Thioglobus sp.]|nr:MAG: hypothetical protein DSZ15_01505 [Candidatus Thioglobus sp.]
MLDYIFFDLKLSGKFKNHLTKVGIEFELNVRVMNAIGMEVKFKEGSMCTLRVSANSNFNCVRI